MVIILFKKLVLVLIHRQTDKLIFFYFFIASTKKLQTNCILFFTEIMDSLSPEKGAASSSKGKNYFLFSLVFL